MSSGYEVIWTEEASEGLNEIMDYLLNKWSERSLKKFLAKLEKRMVLLAENPYLFPVSEKQGNVRRTVLNKHTSIYYRITGKIVELVSIVDNRKDISTHKFDQ